MRLPKKPSFPPALCIRPGSRIPPHSGWLSPSTTRRSGCKLVDAPGVEPGSIVKHRLAESHALRVLRLVALEPNCLHHPVQTGTGNRVVRLRTQAARRTEPESHQPRRHSSPCRTHQCYRLQCRWHLMLSMGVLTRPTIILGMRLGTVWQCRNQYAPKI